MWLSSRQFGSSTVTGKLEDKDTILTVAFLTKMILTVAYLTKMVFMVAYLSKTFFTVTHIWPRLFLQLHTWPRSSLQLYDQNDAYSCIFDQDDFYMTQTILTVKYLTRTISVSLNFTTSFQSPALPFFAHISQLPCFLKPKNMRRSFSTVVWLGIKSCRFPLSSLNTWDGYFAQSCGMEAKITGSLFTNLNTWDGSFGHLPFV